MLENPVILAILGVISIVWIAIPFLVWRIKDQFNQSLRLQHEMINRLNELITRTSSSSS